MLRNVNKNGIHKNIILIQGVWSLEKGQLIQNQVVESWPRDFEFRWLLFFLQNKDLFSAHVYIRVPKCLEVKIFTSILHYCLWNQRVTDVLFCIFFKFIFNKSTRRLPIGLHPWYKHKIKKSMPNIRLCTHWYLRKSPCLKRKLHSNS